MLVAERRVAVGTVDSNAVLCFLQVNCAAEGSRHLSTAGKTLTRHKCKWGSVHRYNYPLKLDLIVIIGSFQIPSPFLCIVLTNPNASL